jgi:hypothetical protein
MRFSLCEATGSYGTSSYRWLYNHIISPLFLIFLFFFIVLGIYQEYISSVQTNIILFIYKPNMHSIMIISFVLIASFHLAFANNSLLDLFGRIDSETPPFDTVIKTAKYEVRRYRPQLWAQVDYTVDASTDFGDKLSIGYMPLFQYITGKNEQQKQIPITAPVIMQQLTSDSSHRRMALIMPASQFSTLDQLPKPTNANVTLVAVNEPLVFACIKFNMVLTSKRVIEREAELREATNSDRIELVSEQESVRVGGYNPPWTLPWFRTNEVCIPLVNQA